MSFSLLWYCINGYEHRMRKAVQTDNETVVWVLNFCGTFYINCLALTRSCTSPILPRSRTLLIIPRSRTLLISLVVIPYSFSLIVVLHLLSVKPQALHVLAIVSTTTQTLVSKLHMKGYDASMEQGQTHLACETENKPGLQSSIYSRSVLNQSHRR